MGLFNYERAKDAYDRKPTKNIEELFPSLEVTKYNELKVSDHRVSYELARLNNNIERLIDIYESKD